jgi:glycosyltransferase involved in cell wall biosynthesis
MKTWHIVTCEYPPQVGGVSDYTRLLAQRLRCAGDGVHVWGPAYEKAGLEAADDSVFVHRSFGDFSKAFLGATQEQMNVAEKSRPRTILVQWVPHGFGKKAMNLAFCRWLERLAKSGDRIELMVHEPYLESGQGSWKQRIVAHVQRRMIRTVLEAASRVHMSIPAWERYLRPYAPSDREMVWLPIPATVPVAGDKEATALVRKRIGRGKLVLGHLGTYSPAITRALGGAIPSTLRAVPSVHVLLLGKGGDEWAAQMRSQAPEFAGRIHASGLLPDQQLSHHLSACDLMLQPFPDGLSSRRTSLMNALAHGVAVVSNSGHLTEEIWEEIQAVGLGATGTGSDLAELCVQLLADEDARGKLASAGAALYQSRFDWPHVVRTLRSQEEALPAGQK